MRPRQFQGCDFKDPSAHDCFPPHSRPARPTYTSLPSQNSLGVLSPPLTPEDPHHSNKTQTEHVESGPYDYYPQSTNDGARRGIMSPLSSSPSPPPTFSFPNLAGTSGAEFTFRISPRPDVPLSFLPQTLPSSESWKRRRATADVDGDNSCLQKKKRRLRLFLITSRLSPQYSHPATNIVDRGSSKIAVWAKQRALGRNVLRKAAILNRVRRQSIYALETAGGLGRVLVEQEKEQEQLELARLTPMYGSHDSVTRPVSKNGGADLPEVVEKSSGEHTSSGGSSPASSTGSPSPPLYARDVDEMDEYRSPNEAYANSCAYPKSPRPSQLPLSPSPLGLSNYDALDLEDDLPDPYAHLEEGYYMENACDEIVEDISLLQTYSASESLGPAYPDFTAVDSDRIAMSVYVQFDKKAGAIWPTVRQGRGRSKDMELSPSSSPNFMGVFANAPTTAGHQSSALQAVPSPTSSSPNFTGMHATGAEEQSSTGRGELNRKGKRRQ